MTYHDFALGLGWLAVSLGVPGTVSQWQRIRTQGIEGVSVATWLLFVWMSYFWISYGFVAHSAQVTWGSLIVVPMQMAILYRLAPWKHRRTSLLATLFFFVMAVLPTAIFGWQAGVYCMTIVMIANRVPQILELLRQPDASGVSAGSWLIGVLGTWFWILYYQNVHLWSALIATAGVSLANIVVFALVVWRHRQMKYDFIAEEVFISNS